MCSNLEVGERIRELRENLHMSRERFSEKINISEVFLGQIERGERSLSIKTLTNIVSYTGSSTDYILFGDSTTNSTIQKINRVLENSTEELNEYIYEIIRNVHELYKNIKENNI